MTNVVDCADMRMISINWADGQSARYPYLWLIDSDPAGFHPDTKERAFDMTTVDEGVAPTSLHLEGDHLRVAWSGTPGESRFDLGWLRDHCPGRRRDDPALMPQETWRADLGEAGVPRWQAHEIARSDAALIGWMRDTRHLGLTVVRGLPDAPDAGSAVAQRIAPLRLTNFGDGFAVAEDF